MHFDVSMENVGRARSFVHIAVDTAAPEQVVTDLVLATSELVTNAFEHAAAPVEVIVRVGEARAWVTIRCAGVAPDRIGDVDGWRTAPPDRITGRGLGIVHHVADHVDVVRTGDELEITVRRDW
jgi:anti-sigma regulatory factor (Ser/Thr protein kinase)